MYLKIWKKNKMKERRKLLINQYKNIPNIQHKMKERRKLLINQYKEGLIIAKEQII